MIDPDLQKQLEAINTNITEFKNKKSAGIWRAFFNGMFGALGYIAGIAIVIVVLGWFLQKTGLLKPFQDQVKNFSDVIDGAKKLIQSTPDQSNNSQQDNGQQGSSLNGTYINLPGGHKAQIVQ